MCNFSLSISFLLSSFLFSSTIRHSISSSFEVFSCSNSIIDDTLRHLHHTLDLLVKGNDDRTTTCVHRIELANKLKSHYYDMCNQLSRNEGVWISGKLWTFVMWFSIACYFYVVISLTVIIYEAVEK